MRLKTKLVLLITALVFVLTGILSLVYVSQLLHSAVRQSYDTNHMVAEQIRFALQGALESGLKDRTVDPNNAAQLRNLEAEAVRNNAPLQAVIDSINRYSLTVYDINIGDNRAFTLLSTNPDNEDNLLPVRPGLKELLDANSIQLMQTVFGPPKVFDVVVPLESRGKTFVTVHVGVRTTFLRSVYEPWLKAALTFMGFALLAALISAFLLSNLALRPLEQISRQLDYWTGSSYGNGDSKIHTEETRGEDMAAHLAQKIERFGQRTRNVEEVYSALKENLDRILGNLQDGILLFTADGRAVLVSEAARRFLSVEKSTLLGKDVSEIFTPSTFLGKTLREAYESGVAIIQQEVHTETGRRVLVSLDFIRDGNLRDGLGALITLHDLESAAEIESELELSRRLAAIGRLTSGVGHEVKNPINAIVLHLELLKTKLNGENARATPHLDVIESEIHRLDRVVQMLVDFSRPVELQLREQNLASIVADVLALASAELAMHNVKLVSHIPTKPLIANVDADLLKQAVLNVIQNGTQAMQDGGTLEVFLEEEKMHENTNEVMAVQASQSTASSLASHVALLRISDQGPGIPNEIREKIFDLYFTTKNGGSGIGLSMTYRILQLHHGSVQVESRAERGAVFLLRIPLVNAELSRRNQKLVRMTG